MDSNQRVPKNFDYKSNAIVHYAKKAKFHNYGIVDNQDIISASSVAVCTGLEPVTSAVVGDTRFELVRGVLNIHFALKERTDYP